MPVPVTSPPTLNIVGAGRVGLTLGRLFAAQNLFVVNDICNRSLERARQAVDFIGAGRAVADIADMRPADVWLLSVPDTQILPVAGQIAHQIEQSSATASAASTLVFHCSGFLSSEVLAPLHAKGWRTASAHPILSFADPETSISQFPGTLCGLEGNLLATAPLRQALTALGATCFDVATDKKALYHAGAIFSTNFTVVVQDIAARLWAHAGVPDALIPGLTDTLLRNAAANILALGPTAALTGPAARGDTEVVTKQCAAVTNWDEDAGEAYRALSVLATGMARRLASNT
jgi:predicted short-subunit dehydrogenase-like oxidoreductase (DUF2520 family)